MICDFLVFELQDELVLHYLESLVYYTSVTCKGWISSRRDDNSDSFCRKWGSLFFVHVCLCVSVSLCRRVDVEGACTDVLVMFVLLSGCRVFKVRCPNSCRMIMFATW